VALPTDHAGVGRGEDAASVIACVDGAVEIVVALPTTPTATIVPTLFTVAVRSAACFGEADLVGIATGLTALFIEASADTLLAFGVGITIKTVVLIGPGCFV